MRRTRLQVLAESIERAERHEQPPHSASAEAGAHTHCLACDGAGVMPRNGFGEVNNCPDCDAQTGMSIMRHLGPTVGEAELASLKAHADALAAALDDLTQQAAFWTTMGVNFDRELVDAARSALAAFRGRS